MKVETKRKILVVYCYREHPMRATTREHLYSFREYSDDHVIYLNMTFTGVPEYLSRIRFDLIIFHTLFLTQHWSGEAGFRRLLQKAKLLKEMKGIKVMLPQDEFINSSLFSSFINEFGIDHVFSVAPEELWPKIYPGVDFSRVRFTRVLTGYLDEKQVGRLAALSRTTSGRTIDIGYRTAGHPYFWFGRHGFLKAQIADAFLEATKGTPLSVDIKTEGKDAILGEAWYEFLLNCRYTIGVEGGTSLIDPDGSISRKVDEYCAAHPDAGFEDVETACFPGRDGTAELYALSPRHLEACLTRTCQILTTGHYNGILKPGLHYIPLNRDFSNINEVLAKLGDECAREAIVERAYRDIIAPGLYTYRNFVGLISREALGDKQPDAVPVTAEFKCIAWWLVQKEAMEWKAIAALKRIPSPVYGLIQRIWRSIRAG